MALDVEVQEKEVLYGTKVRSKVDDVLVKVKVKSITSGDRKRDVKISRYYIRRRRS